MAGRRGTVLAALGLMCSLGRLASCGDPPAGPFFMQVNEFFQCPNSGTKDIDFHSTKINRIDKDRTAYNANYTLKVPMDENVKGLLILKSWGNGGWKEAFKYDSSYVCNDLKTIAPEIHAMLAKNAGNTCPIPEGTHLIETENLKVDLNLPQFTYGKYSLTLSFIKEESVIGCLGMSIDVKPKKKAHKHKKG